MNKTKNYKYIVALVLTTAHQLITFFMDKSIFSASPSDNPADYIVCKLCALIIMWFVYLGIINIITDRNRKNQLLARTLKAALPYLIIIIGISFIKLKGGYLSNDESLIYENAISLTHYTWFYYITTYYYIISLMIIPHMYAPIFIKLIIEYLVIGYTLVRITDYFKSKSSDALILKPLRIEYGHLIYLLFIMYPVIAYTTSAHRLPIYFLLYLYLIVTLLFDKLEQVSLTYKKGFFLLLLSAVLTQWRTEGIYLLILVPILMLFTYGNLIDKSQNVKGLKKLFPAFKMLICFLILQYIVSIPQNGFVASDMSAAADDRMKPFYAYTITNMCRNGLDFQKNIADLEVVDKYISLESLEAINEYYGDINYEDVLILYQPGFIGVREEADVTEYYNFVIAMKNIFKNNPEVFLKTRLGAFCYAALPFHITYSGISPKSLISFVISIIKTVSYNLFIPLFIITLLCIYSLVRKRLFTFFLMGGLLGHWFIVFILAPASYFKYYFPVYITAYLYLFLLIIQVIYNRKHSEKISFIR